MNKVLMAILTAAVFPGLISMGKARNVDHIEKKPQEQYLHPGADTSGTNPYLKIRKFDLDIVTPSSGVQFYEDGILFLYLTKMEEKMISNHISFGERNLYYASIDDSALGNVIPLNMNNQLLIPADGITFTGDFSRFYYSKLSERDEKVKIYMGRSADSGNDQGWMTDNNILCFCENHNYTHPTISPEGDLMIFSSDMPGGAGGLDLYITRYENGEWTNPVNMGGEINSPGAEIYACLDGDDNLYYSSDGLDGLGGYDIFFCSFNGTGWDGPVNLKDQVNTVNDEVAFKINREGKNIGFYTMIEKYGIGQKQSRRTLYIIRPVDKYMDARALMLSDILMNFASGSHLTAKFEEDEEDVVDIEIKDEVKTDEDRITDSLRAEKLIADRLAREERIADSLRAEEIKAERLAYERMEAARIADSLQSEILKQEEAEVSEDRVTYRIQILSSNKKDGTYNILVNGTKYDTWEYYYKGAWRITIGEFEELEDAREMQSKCRNSGYDQAFVVAFVNDERSLDMSLFRK